MKKKFLILFFSIAALMHFDSIKPMDPTEPSNNKLSTEDPCQRPPAPGETNIKNVSTDCLRIILEYFSNNKPKRLLPVALVNKEFKELVSTIPVSFTLGPQNIEQFFAHDCLFKNIEHLTIKVTSYLEGFYILQSLRTTSFYNPSGHRKILSLRT